MENRVLLNNGKSSLLKTPSLPSTYAEFKSQMEAGQMCDVTPRDSLDTDPGISAVGTPLNVANLLSNNTATALGLTSSATPNDAFAEIANWEVVNTVQFLTSDWSANTGGGYKAVKTVTGISSSSQPIPSLHYSTMTEATSKLEAKAYSKVIKFETGAGTITAYAYAVPANSFYVDFKGI